MDLHENNFRSSTFVFLVGLLLPACFATTVVELSGDYGTFQSPNYPQPYPPDQDIEWHISAPEGYRVMVYFTWFDLEDSYDEDYGGACAYDYVQVHNCFGAGY